MRALRCGAGSLRRSAAALFAGGMAATAGRSDEEAARSGAAGVAGGRGAATGLSAVGIDAGGTGATAGAGFF